MQENESMQVLCTTKTTPWMPRPMSGQGRMVREAGKGKGSKKTRTGGGSFCPPSGPEQTQQKGERKMSRLIRDTDLMQDLAECTMVAIDRSGTGLEWKDYIKLDDVVRVIKSQPTAYDVEAVVRELEAISTFYAHGAEKDKDIGHAYVATRKYGISDGLDIAIEIVRGGRNERTD